MVEIEIAPWQSNKFSVRKERKNVCQIHAGDGEDKAGNYFNDGGDKMQECNIYYEGLAFAILGVIKKGYLYCFPDEYEKDDLPTPWPGTAGTCSRLIRFDAGGKWGFADVRTGEIKIEPVWDYTGPFRNGYAAVALGSGYNPFADSYTGAANSIGKQGYIDMNGKIVIPVEYCFARDMTNEEGFIVSRNKKWGMIDKHNEEVISMVWDEIEIGCSLIFCARKKPCKLYVSRQDWLRSVVNCAKPIATGDYKLKWAVYHASGTMLIEAILDEKPQFYKTQTPLSGEGKLYREGPAGYFLIKKGNKYGVLAGDGRLVAEISFLKRQAAAVIKQLCG